MTSEHTLIIIKPDGVAKKIEADVIDMIRTDGLAPLFRKAVLPTREMMDRHYTFDDAWREKVGKGNIALCRANGLDPYEIYGSDEPKAVGEAVRQMLLDYMSGKRVIAWVIAGDEDVVARVRALCGPSMPADAPKHTIRGKFGTDSALTALREKRCVHNVIHSSGSREEAKAELALWFPEHKF
jgi:nucleoside-diphosphate kinase